MINGIERIARAYNLFKEDETSRKIFLSRLLYSATGDVRHIADMVTELELGVNPGLLRVMYGRDGYSGPGIIIFGAGSAGFNCLLIFRHLGVPVACFCDNDSRKHGSLFYDLPVVAPSELTEKYADHPLLIATGVQRYSDEIGEQLNAMGFPKERVFSHPSGHFEQYFESFLPQCEQEIFIDGGGLHGESVIAFKEWSGASYAACHIFEPHPGCMDTCKKNLDGAGLSNSVHYAPYGLWDKDETLFFTSRHYGISSVAATEEEDLKKIGFIHGAPYKEDACSLSLAATGEEFSIQTTTLDAYLNGAPATFIKMDIEGAELNALRGSAETIRKYAPKLAISVYHRPEDIIELPLLIDDIAPGYTFRLQHYTFGPQETVLYAMRADGQSVSK